MSITKEYYSAIKKNTVESVLMRWMKLEPIIQSEASQKEKHQYTVLTHKYAGGLLSLHCQLRRESILGSGVWMKLEPIIQSEVSQKEKHQYSIITDIYGI